MIQPRPENCPETFVKVNLNHSTWRLTQNKVPTRQFCQLDAVAETTNIRQPTTVIERLVSMALNKNQLEEEHVQNRREIKENYQREFTGG